jgi:hypothetical protein
MVEVMTWKKCGACTRAIAANAFSCEYCGQLCDDVMGYLPSEDESAATAMTEEESQAALAFAFESREPDPPADMRGDELTISPELFLEVDPGRFGDDPAMRVDADRATPFDAEPAMQFDSEAAIEARSPDQETAARAAAPATASESPKPPVKGLGPRQLAMVGGGVLAAGALIFTILGSRGSAALEPAATASPAPAPAPRAAAPAPAPRKPAPPGTDVPAAGAPHWSRVVDGRWVSPGRHTAAFQVAAIERVHVWTREVTPVLVVRCDSGKTEAFVYTQSAARMEPEDGDHTVTVAFDDGSSTSERWPDSDEHDALFARRPVDFTRQLTEARALHFGFTPHNAAPALATFVLDGLEPLLASSAKQCGWKP